MKTELAPPPARWIEDDVARALAEDLGAGDVTAALLPDGDDIAYLLCKQDAVVCGRPWFDACHRSLDPDVRIEWRVAEGERVAAGTVLATLAGRTRALVSAERTALNFLQTLSGTATITAAARRRGARHRHAHPRHPQDHARPAPRAEIRGARGRRRATTAWACTTRSC